MTHIAYSIIEKARQDLLIWCNSQKINLHKIEFTAAFEKWNKQLGVWIFFEKNNDLEFSQKDGATRNIEDKFLSILKEKNYPFDEFPKVIFEFDSHENVVKNFQGNYFYRLR